jgi:glycosyltransferase involved in cell wall biosynthesis
MKRILFFVNSMQPSGGIERVIATLVNRLSNDYEITILVKDQPCSFYKLNNSIKIDTINNELVFNMDSRISRIFTTVATIFSTGKLLRRYFEQNKFDYYYLTHPVSVLEFHFTKVDFNNVIISEHAARVHYNFVYRFMKKMLYKNCRAYVVPTKADSVAYKQEDNFPAVNIPHFRSDIPYSFSEKQKNVVLNIGRFTSDKQQLILLYIWNEIILENNLADWTLHIVGSGELADEMYNFVKVNNLEQKVLFLPPIHNIEEYYSNASIFALTSKSEGFGMVLLEAISFGLPCVSFNCPSGPQDIIKNGINGYLVELNNRNEFKLRLTALIKNKELMNEMGVNAHLSAIEWADSAILAKWYQILN